MNPNPFRNAFRASDAHIFEAQIGAHMAKTARREGHIPGMPKGPAMDEWLTKTEGAVLMALRNDGPGTAVDLGRRIGKHADVARCAAKELVKSGLAREIGKNRAPNDVKIWEAVN